MDCIGENTIGALFDHRLAKHEVDAIDAHVAGCDACRDLLCSMARLYASSSHSRALAQTAASLGGETRGEEDANIKRLLALLGCERQVGRVLGGKWRLETVLGVGGMAEVYSATHLSNGRRAAIKLLRPEWLSQPNVVFRFLREGYVANRINHTGAVSILDDGTAEDGLPYLVLELLDGHTIASHVREPLPLATVLWIASEILDVLSVAHDQQIVHRDIKPENVLLTREGAIKVLDFGIASTRELAEGRATQQGMLMGTPSYMPPEQARGDRDAIDARTDVWAVGATMFALLAGKPVHDKGTPNERLVAAMRERAPKLASIAPDVPREICAIVDRALAFERSDRWESARAMQDAIRALASGKRPRRRRYIALGALLTAALVTSVAYARRSPVMRAEPAPVITVAPAEIPPVVTVTVAASLPAASVRAKPAHHAAPPPRRAEPPAPPPVVSAAPPPPLEHPLDRRE